MNGLVKFSQWRLEELHCVKNEQKGGKPMDKVQCTICGGMFDPNEMVVMDNGNTACPECAAREDKDE